VVVPGKTGVLNEDLCQAGLGALKLDDATCVEHARAHSWQRCAELFASYLEPITAF
jgi:hypothetical protein